MAQLTPFIFLTSKIFLFVRKENIECLLFFSGKYWLFFCYFFPNFHFLFIGVFQNIDCLLFLHPNIDGFLVTFSPNFDLYILPGKRSVRNFIRENWYREKYFRKSDSVGKLDFPKTKSALELTIILIPGKNPFFHLKFFIYSV